MVSQRLALRSRPMPPFPRASSHLPDDAQTLLIRATVAEADVARAAWHQWQQRTPWETEAIDAASQRLLPLVYMSLSRIDPSISGLKRLKGTYRRTWLENSRLLHLARPAIRALIDAGHRVMVIKGASLTFRYYGGRGARPMGDVDVLVPAAEARAALVVLERLGWVCTEGGHTAGEVLARHHAVNLKDDQGGRVDLHRQLLADAPPDADASLWERAEPLMIDGVRVLAPSAPDELLLACVHGWEWSAVPSIRWVPDALAIARHMRGDDDWGWLAEGARRRQVAFRLSRALRVLCDRFGADIPATILQSLEAGPFAKFEIAEERNHTNPPGMLPPGLPRAYYAALRETGKPDGLVWWINCARRFWFVANPPSGRELAPWLARWATRRITSRSAARRAARRLSTGMVPPARVSIEAGTVTRRVDPARAHSLNEPHQPARTGTTPEDRSRELDAIVDYLAVDRLTHRRYQPRQGLTFCNVYAHDVCNLAGVYLPRVWWTPGAIESWGRGKRVEPALGKTVREQRANALFDWFRDFGSEFGWRQVHTATEIQAGVNRGAIGVIVARRPDLGSPGHITVVMPEAAGLQAQRAPDGSVIAPLQSQAGAINFQRATGRAEWWKGDEFAASAFWLHA